MRPNAAPFGSFLEKCVTDGWISSYGWDEAADLASLRERWRSFVGLGYSRSHKKLAGGGVMGLWIRGDSVGVDLETLRPLRPVWMRDGARVAARMGLPADSSYLDKMRDWCLREACYKALGAESDGARLEDIRAFFEDRALWIRNGVRRAEFETRSVWNEDFFLCVAKLCPGMGPREGNLAGLG